jgi:uncharacterized protein (TIGR01777 family)
MTYAHSVLVEAPIEEVFAWHTRPGALRRLVPPWMPVRVMAEAESLQDGRAVLGLPAGVRWVATQQPDAYDPPHRFADQLTSEPLASVLRWTHNHQFRSEDDKSTSVSDTVTSRLPGSLLREMFAYRTRQLRCDLAAHARAAGRLEGPMTVAVTGSSGLIGSALSAFLTTGGHQVIHLVRQPPQRPDQRRWAPEDPDPDLLDGVDAVVHLAGASIAGRFSAGHKEKIRASRIGPTARLAEVAARTPRPPRGLITASAIGYYGTDRSDEVLTEKSERGDGFLADVVSDWEAATTPARDGGVRVVHVRTGVVQSPSGGTLRLLYPLFAAGLGGRLGDGQQWHSWVGLDDLLDIYLQALVDTSLAGPLNAVAPEPVRNDEYTSTLAGVLNRPAVVPVPGFGPRLLLGEEGDRELARASQRVIPQRLTDAGHQFRYPDLQSALRHCLGRTRRAPSG